ncbi:hypothetical protein [Acidipropionibacterium virtanenii]|nr:hypothetical protein [Acidipropionibacterium virtanenii]
MNIGVPVGARRPVRRWLSAQTMAWICLAAFWLYIWRTPIWSADDLLFATRSGTSHGRIAWDRVLPLLADDVNNRVGRSADMLAQFIFSTGPLIGIIMAACCFLQSFAVWRLLRAVSAQFGKGDDVVSRIVALAAGVALPLSLLATEPGLAGSTVMFMAANVGYVLGSAMMVAAAVLLWRVRERGSAPLWQLVLVVAFACFVGIHHELLALGIAGVVMGLAVVTRRSDWRPSWVIALLVVLAVSFGRYAAGGLWKRQDRLLRPFPIDDLSAVQQHRVLAVFAVSQSLGVHPELYICLAAAVAALAWAVRRKVAHPQVFVAILVVFVVSAAAMAMVATKVRRNVTLNAATLGRAEIYSAGSATLLLGVTAVAVAAMVVLVVSVRTIAQARIVVPVTGMMLGLYSMPVLLGSPYGRTLYVPMLMCMVASVTMAMVALAMVRADAAQAAQGADSAQGVGASATMAAGDGERANVVAEDGERASRVPAAAVAAVLVLAASIGPAVQGGTHLVNAVDSNIVVWKPVVRQLEAAEMGSARAVVIPKNLPRADYAADYTGVGVYYRGNLAKYCGIPASIRIKTR